MSNKCLHCSNQTDGRGLLCRRCRYEQIRDIDRKWAAQESEERERREDRRNKERQRAERREDAAIQQQLLRESHLNAIKLMLLEHAARGTSDPDSAIASLKVIMRSTDFQANLEWFWGDIARNPLLMDAYFTEALGSLAGGSVDAESAVKHFDKMPAVTRTDLQHWLARQSTQSSWRRFVSPLLEHYRQVEESRQQEKRRIEAERKARIEEEERNRRAREAAEASRLHREEQLQKQKTRDEQLGRRRRFEILGLLIITGSAIMGAGIAWQAEFSIFRWLVIQLIGWGIGGYKLMKSYPEQQKLHVVVVGISSVILSAMMGGFVAGLTDTPFRPWFVMQLIGWGIGGQVLMKMYPEQLR